MTNSNPGKFEGEPSCAEALWRMALDGASDEEFYDGETKVDVFTIDADLCMALRAAEGVDVADVANLTLGNKLTLWEDNNGFVYVKEWPAKQLARFMQECEEENREEEVTA